jgi:hypothetical protein
MGKYKAKPKQRRLNADEQYESNKFIEKYLQETSEKKYSWSILAKKLSDTFDYDDYEFRVTNVSSLAKGMIKRGGKAPERNCHGVAKQNKEACKAFEAGKLNINFWLLNHFSR